MNAAGSNLRLAVPQDFTKPSSSYRLQAWMAMLGLLLFVVLYVGLASWFTYTAYRMIAGVFAGGEGAVAGFFAALPAAFLAIFMWKALFFVRVGSDKPGIEITAANQGELLTFLHELADEIGAPRPHRVFISPNVNAAVFYDLSVLNFILPSKKNLIIGLGLVNSLTRSEFKAVLAHEFGHFAQRTMAVGRWVYIWEQIAQHIIAKRDWLDRTLDFISAIDLRVAWIGWIMRTVVWSIRSLMETVFRLVIIAQRALSREMEFQADLVAVSVTGSDALVHALYRLQPADEDWERTITFANLQLSKGRIVTDLYAIQARVGDHMRRILCEPNHGLVPKLPTTKAASHRVFTEQIAQPPRMWSTHPPNTEREANAKRNYIPAPLHNDPAWSLLHQSEQLREQVTQFVFADINFEPKPTIMSTEEAIAALDEQFAHKSYEPTYRGAYLGRPVTIGVADASQLLGEAPAREDIADSLEQLYPEFLHDSLAELRNLNEEFAMLEAIHDGVYDATGGVIQHRGETVKRSRLPHLIEQTKQERDHVLSLIEQHDQLCRTTHNVAARYVAHGWQDYHHSLIQLLHYAEHSEADLNDAYLHLANVTSMATAAGRVGAGKLRKVMDSAGDLYSVMLRLDRNSTKVELPASVLGDLDVENWRAALDKLELPPASEHNIGDWLNVLDSWVIPMRRRFGQLRTSALEELLKSEQRISRMYRGEEEPCQAPSIAKVSEDYKTRVRNSERKRQKKLDWWSRFTLADGTGYTVLRLAVAATIVAAVVTAGAFVGSAKVVVFNGLSVGVNVHVNHHDVTVRPFQHRSISVGAQRSGIVEARTSDGRLIESFQASLEKGFANYVYNVAGAAPMVEWTATYGTASPRKPDLLGFPRWRTTGADHVFSEPPRQIKMSGSGATRLVLSSDATSNPSSGLALIMDASEQERVIKTHARWDAADAQHIGFWLMRASEFSGFDEILSARLEFKPNDVMTLRAQQDTAKGDDKQRILDQHLQLGQQHPDDADWQYIAIRAMPSGPEQDEAFLAAELKWPTNAWLGNACGYVHTRQADWQKALRSFQSPLRSVGPLHDGVAIQVARVRRLLAHEGLADLNDLGNSTALAYLLQLESGVDLQGTQVFGYSLLNKGKVTDAYQAAGGDKADNHMLVLLATSQDALPQWQQRALEIPINEIADVMHHLYLAALAFRLQRPHEPYLKHFEEQYEADEKSPLSFVRKLIEQGPKESIEAELIGVDLQPRGTALATAVIMYPEKAPDVWRKSAKKLLFATERPSL